MTTCLFLLLRMSLVDQFAPFFDSRDTLLMLRLQRFSPTCRATGPKRPRREENRTNKLQNSPYRGIPRGAYAIRKMLLNNGKNNRQREFIIDVSHRCIERIYIRILHPQEWLPHPSIGFSEFQETGKVGGKTQPAIRGFP